MDGTIDKEELIAIVIDKTIRSMNNTLDYFIQENMTNEAEIMQELIDNKIQEVRNKYII